MASATDVKNPAMTVVYVLVGVSAIVLAAAASAARTGWWFDAVPEGPGRPVVSPLGFLAQLLATMAFIPAFAGMVVDNPLRRLAPALGAYLMLTTLLLVAALGAFLVAALGGVLGIILAVGGIIWLGSRLILALPLVLLDDATPTAAIGRSWRETRGMAALVALGVAGVGLGSALVSAFAGQFGTPMQMAFGGLATAAGQAGIMVWAFRATRDEPAWAPAKPAMDPTGRVPRSLVLQGKVDEADVRLVVVASAADVAEVAESSKAGPVWAQLETNDESVLVAAVKAGASVLVADQVHAAVFRLDRVDGPRVARLRGDRIQWSGHQYARSEHGWQHESFATLPA